MRVRRVADRIPTFSVSILNAEPVTVQDSSGRLFDYELWALRRLLEALESSPRSESAATTFAHVLHAYQIWHDRIDGIDGPVTPWEKLTIPECRDMLDRLERRYRVTLERLTRDDLRSSVTYRTTEGQQSSNSTGDILLHLSLHSAYHRGQVNRYIREAGGEPAVIDFIVFARE